MIKIHYILTLSLIALMTCQESVAMRLSAQWLKDCGKFGASLATAMVCTHKYISEYKNADDITSVYTRLTKEAKNSPQPQSEAFIRDALHKAYPELTQQDIKIVPHAAFALNNHYSTHFIHSPLTDKELNFASLVKSGVHSEIPQTIVAQSIEKQKLNWSTQEWLANQELAGRGFTQTSLDLWRCQVTLLGARIKNNDIKQEDALAYASIPAIAFACVKNMHKFSPIALASAWAAHFVAPTALNYWQFYRADQETIKRIEDPAALRAMSNSLKNLPFSFGVPTLKGHLFASFFKNIRAPYYTKAAEMLETKLERN